VKNKVVKKNVRLEKSFWITVEIILILKCNIYK